MTQDQPQTPEPNQPQPAESPIEPSVGSPDDAGTIDAGLTDASPTEVSLTEVSSTDTTSEENQLQSIGSLPEASLTDAESSATEEQPVEAPAETPVQVPAAASPSSVKNAETSVNPSPSPAKPQATSSSKTSAFLRLIGQLWGIVLPLLIIVARWAWQVTLITLKWIREAWKVALPRIRTLLPAGWRKLPDWALTTVAVALLVFVLWLTVQLLPGKAPATARTGDRSPAAIDTPSPEQPSAPDPELIANIQTQVAEVTDEYAEGLIQAVQADFRDNLLTVKVGDAWYMLDATSQDRLANELLKRSHKLDFNALEISNVEGERLARSPVVGTKMVVYQRTRNEG